MVTIDSGGGFPHFGVTYTGLGITTNKHAIGHALYAESDRDGWAMSERIRAFHFWLIARLMRRLKAVPEGDGTMLGNTVVVYLSDGAETHHSTGRGHCAAKPSAPAAPRRWVTSGGSTPPSSPPRVAIPSTSRRRAALYEPSAAGF